MIFNGALFLLSKNNSNAKSRYIGLQYILKFI